MTIISRRLALTVLFVGFGNVTWAQTADEIVERYLKATGGREAYAKLKSRTATGTITLSTPAGDISGSIEVVNAAPNKSRSLIKADLSSLGAGSLVLDQRFDGSTGYVIDTLQGNRDVTGAQLENLKNSIFPTPLMNYKELGAVLKLSGKEKVGDREAYVIDFDPPSGSVVRYYFDAATYVPIQMVIKVDVPQLGREVEQTTEFLDLKDVDGVKIPFRLRATSDVQNFTISIAKVEHNGPIDETIFKKPAP